MDKIAQVLDIDCTGPNISCRRAAKRGRKVHVIPAGWGPGHPILVMPTYHYDTIEDGFSAVRKAIAEAPTVETDEDLFLYRRMRMAHWLPVGWVDPSRR